MNKVLDVKANDDYSLDLRFSDGSVKRFDVKPFLDRGVFRELKNPDYFKRVGIAFGTVQWPNEQDISPDTLYIDGNAIDEASSSLASESVLTTT